MLTIRCAGERGHVDKGWLEAYHTFSFDTYLDPDWMGFHHLRVLNEGTLKGGKGFASHFHKDMEIITYVIDGVLEHKDSLGNTCVIQPGEVNRLSSGSGVTHSQHNLSHHVPVHFFEIWINPKVHGLPPSDEQQFFSSASKWGQWCLILSSNGRNGSMMIHQDVDIYATLLEEGDEINFDALSDRYYWLQVLSGSFNVQKNLLKSGDGISMSEESRIMVSCRSPGELLLLDLAEL
ncbi:MAG: pirin family protein [Chlamydiia bacterium]|nr:pirin family protein [Chlamydiia bacterium]